MLRISTTESAENAVTLRLEGQIVEPWTGELNTACERFLSTGRPLVLDLGDVTMIDRPALALLAALSRRAVTLTRCSPFHEEQLKRANAPDEEAVAK